MTTLTQQNTGLTLEQSISQRYASNAVKLFINSMKEIRYYA